MSNDLIQNSQNNLPKLKVRRKKTNKIYKLDVCGTDVQTVQDDNGKKFVVIRRICENLGLIYSRQLQKIKRDSKFNCVHMYTVGKDYKKRKIVCLPIEQYEGWLFSINSKKVKEESKELLIKYQSISMKALHNFWNIGIAVATTDDKVIIDSLNKQLELKDKEIVDLKLKSNYGWGARTALDKRYKTEIEKTINDKVPIIVETIKEELIKSINEIKFASLSNKKGN